MTAVVFDFDGVLADTEPLHLRAFQETFAARGWSLDPGSYVERYLGYDDAGLVEVFARDRGLALDADDVGALLDAKSRAYRRLIESGAVLCPGAARCVARLATRHPLAIASGALRAEITDILEGAGLLAPFRAVVGVDDVARSKPAPDCYLRAAELLGVPPHDCVAVEDSRRGLEAARSAGMRTIAVTTTSPAADLAAADRILTDLTALTDAVIDELLAGGR